METKKQKIFSQYIDQYQISIHKTLEALRDNKTQLHIPYAQFLFSTIDYYGLLFIVATKKHYNKRDKNNFIEFFSSSYFPSKDRCKSSFLYFIRNGVIHQVFSKASSIGKSPQDKLFFKDVEHGNIPALNLDYLDRVTIKAINGFINDLKINHNYIDNLYDILITDHYALDDHKELATELNTNFGGDIQKIFDHCN